MEQRIGDILPGEFALGSVCSEIVNQRRQQSEEREDERLPPRNRQLLRRYRLAEREFERVPKVCFQSVPVLPFGFRFRCDHVWMAHKMSRRICPGFYGFASGGGAFLVDKRDEAVFLFRRFESRNGQRPKLESVEAKKQDVAGLIDDLKAGPDNDRARVSAAEVEAVVLNFQFCGNVDKVVVGSIKSLHRAAIK
jgi:hypothetical protein